MLKIAKKGKTHTIAEELIHPFKIDMVSKTFSPQDSAISYFIKTNIWHGSRWSEPAKETNKSHYFFLEILMDDSTDVANCIQFCATSREISVILFMKTYSFENLYAIIKQVKVFLCCSLKQ